jgi:putative tricarboxylic transport membrane protein
MLKKGILFLLLAAFFIFLCGQVSVRAAYPEKPMTILVWGAPGSATDILARTLAAFSEKDFGQQIQILNKPGGNGIVAQTYLLGKPADGYWSILVTNSMIPVLLKGTQPFNLDSFDFVIRIVTDPLLLAVRKQSPYKTLEDFIAAAKENPGKIKVSGSLRGGVYEQTAFELMKAAKIKLNYIPYQGGSKAVVAAVGGEVDAVICVYSPMLGLVKSGDLRLLASSSTEPEPELKIPTFTEKKLDVTTAMWRGIAVEKGTPPEIVEKLHAVFKKQILSAAWKQKYIEKYEQRQGYLGPADFTKAMKNEEKSMKAFLQTIEKPK